MTATLERSLDRYVHAAAHYLPYVVLALAAFEAASIAAGIGWLSPPYADQPRNPTVWGVAVNMLILALVLAMLRMHKPYLCPHCHRRKPRPALAARLRALVWLGHGPAVQWQVLTMTCGLLTLIALERLLPAITVRLWLDVAIVLFCVAAVAHRHLEPWCPRCRRTHPHRVSAQARAQSMSLCRFGKEHTACAVDLACTTGSCTSSMGLPVYYPPRLLADWYTEHLNRAHRAATGIGYRAECHRHGQHQAETAAWPD